MTNKKSIKLQFQVTINLFIHLFYEKAFSFQIQKYDKTHTLACSNTTLEHRTHPLSDGPWSFIISSYTFLGFLCRGLRKE